MATKHINREEEILKAAEAEFMNKGFSGAKTTSIASAAGVTHAMLHYYFRTKKNLYDKVFEKKVSLMGAILASSFTRTDLPLIEKIKVGMDAHFEYLKNNPNLPRFLVNEVIFKPENFRLIVEKVNLMAESVIQVLQKEINAEVLKGNVEDVKAVDIMITIMSLNIFVFITFPVWADFTASTYSDNDEFLEARKKENIELIIRRLSKR